MSVATKPRDLVARFLSDVQGFLRGSDQMADALDDTARGLDKAADAGDDSARRLARAYDRAGDQMKREARATAKATSKSYADAGKDAGDEFAENLGEAVSSGDLSGILAGTAGGLVNTFGKGGPIALAFAALTAVGVGAFTQIQAASEKAKQAAIDTFEEILSGADRESRLRGALERQYGSYLEGLEKIRDMAAVSGIPVERIADAFADGGPAAAELAADAERIAAALYGNADPKLGPTQYQVTLTKNLAEDLERAAGATERAAAAEQARASALRISAQYYAASGSSYAAGGSTYKSQLGAAAPYATGTN